MGKAPRKGSEADFLSRFPTFSQYGGGLHRVVKAADRVTLPANWAFIHEGTPGDALYILLSGTVGVYIGRTKVAELGPGEVVGEASLRDNTLRSATVSTQEPVEMLRIESADFQKLARETPALRRAVEATVERNAVSSKLDD